MMDYVGSKKMVNMDLLIKQVVPHSESESMRKKERISGNIWLYLWMTQRWVFPYKVVFTRIQQ